MNWITVDEVYLGDWINDKPHGLGEHIWGNLKLDFVFF